MVPYLRRRLVVLVSGGAVLTSGLVGGVVVLSTGDPVPAAASIPASAATMPALAVAEAAFPAELAPAAVEPEPQPEPEPEPPPPPPPAPKPAPVARVEVAPKPAERAPVAVPKDPYAPEPIRQIGNIYIPKIGLDQNLMQGITLRNIDKGPSHWPGTAMPGENGNLVVAGHRTTNTKPFRRIDELRPGDQVFFTVDDVTTAYHVTGSQIVTPDAMWITDQTATATATLFACHPPGSAKQRYVVFLAISA